MLQRLALYVRAEVLRQIIVERLHLQDAAAMLLVRFNNRPTVQLCRVTAKLRLCKGIDNERGPSAHGTD